MNTSQVTLSAKHGCISSNVRKSGASCQTCSVYNQPKRLARRNLYQSKAFLGKCSPLTYQASSTRVSNRNLLVFAQDQNMSEQDAWKKREEEAKEAGTSGNSDKWEWTLNWNEIKPLILVGSCPRSPADVDRLVEEAEIDAIVCLQSDACFEALGINWMAIRERALERGVVMTRVAVRDFDHNDQANMLPEAVRVLAGHVSANRRTYVHCTAGINRATLTVVGFFTFIENMELDDAVKIVKQARSVAHPYIDCWKTAFGRMLEGRGEELTWRSKAIYEERSADGREGNSDSDWKQAQIQLVRDSFQRKVAIDMTTTSAITAIATHTLKSHSQEIEELKGKTKELQTERDAAVTSEVESQLAIQQAESQLKELRQQLSQNEGTAQKRAETAEQKLEEMDLQMKQMQEEMRSLRAQHAEYQLERSASSTASFISASMDEGEVEGTSNGDVVTSWLSAHPTTDPLLEYCLDNPDLEVCKVYYNNLAEENDKLENAL